MAFDPALVLTDKAVVVATFTCAEAEAQIPTSRAKEKVIADFLEMARKIQEKTRRTSPQAQENTVIYSTPDYSVGLAGFIAYFFVENRWGKCSTPTREISLA
ncbi:hypothetical protein HDF16_003480 [Granulicella aggregans]|uniref:Uncharacterized protein n=1 Tax=Granulicella aggregans TaxID=474949 RepID=A0A7W7ZGD1_9BACT|nr:hypothetical protein [Granulicella aggregans]